MSSQTRKEAIAKLKVLLEAHEPLGKEIIQADNDKFFSVDLVAQAVIHRSMALIHGFMVLEQEGLFLAAAPLVRMQLDSLLRFYALFRVSRPHDVAHEILKGTPVSKIKDKENQKMLDSYLCKKLSVEENESWIETVYKSTSGFVHLSEKHLHAVFSMDIGQNGDFTLSINGKDSNIPDAIWIEGAEALIAITELLFKYLQGWGYTKNNPDQIATARTQSVGTTNQAAVAKVAKPIGHPKAVRKPCITGKIPLAIDHALAYTDVNRATTPLNDALPRWLFYCPSSWRAQ